MNGIPSSNPQQGQSQTLRHSTSIPEPNRRQPVMVSSSNPTTRVFHGTHDTSLPSELVPSTLILPKVEGRPISAAHNTGPPVDPPSRTPFSNARDHATTMQSDVSRDHREHPPDLHTNSLQPSAIHCVAPGNGVSNPSIPFARTSGHEDSVLTHGSSQQNMPRIASRLDANMLN